MFLMYLRKSRADGEHETIEEVLAKHYKMLQEYAVSKLGGAIPEELIYREVVSGETIQDRPEMIKVLERIQNENITGVLVVEPQRLSRGDLSDCGTIIRAFRYTQTLIVTPPKTYDLEDKFDRKFFEMELMRGNDYLEYVKEIMNRGKIASVQEGNYIGSFAPYGYDRIKEGKSFTLTPNAESDVVRLIFELWAVEGLGSDTIANRLNALHIKPRKSQLWNTGYIRQMLQNPVYIGKIRWNYRKAVKRYEDGNIIKSHLRSKPQDCMTVEGKHEAIISEELYNAAQSRFGTVPKNKSATKLKNPFAGIIHCTCGKAMAYRHQPPREPRLNCPNQPYCNNKSVNYNEFVEEVLHALAKSVEDFKELSAEPEKSIDAHKAITAGLRKELNALETQQERLYDFLEQGIYTSEVFIKRNAALAQRRSELHEAIAEAESHEDVEVNYKQKIISLKEAITILQNDAVTAEDKNRLLRAVIKDITFQRQADIQNKLAPVPFTIDIELL